MVRQGVWPTHNLQALVLPLSKLERDAYRRFRPDTRIWTWVPKPTQLARQLSIFERGIPGNPTRWNTEDPEVFALQLQRLERRIRGN